MCTYVTNVVKKILFVVDKNNKKKTSDSPEVLFLT